MQKPDLFAAPELRGYQENLVGATLDALAHPKEDPPGVILQSHCGSGKTAMNLAVAKHFIDKGQPVVYLVHKAEILEQTYNAAQAWGTVSTGVDIGIVKAGQKLRGADFCLWLCSQQTASRPNKAREKVLKAINPALVIVDEGHHVAAEHWSKLLNKTWPGALHLAATATPWRLDDKSFREVGFGNMVLGRDHGASFKELLEAGHLVQPEIQSVEDHARATASGVWTADGVRAIVRDWYARAGTRQTAMYFAQRRECKVVVDWSQSPDWPWPGLVVDWLDAKGSGGNRAAIVDRIRRGITNLVVNVDVISEGFDAPALGCAVLGRTTEALNGYIQRASRCMRPSPDGIRPILLDYVGAVGKFGPPDTEHDWTVDGKPTDIEDEPTPGLGTPRGPRKLKAWQDELHLRNLPGMPWVGLDNHGGTTLDMEHEGLNEAQIQSIWLKRADAVSDHQQALTLCWMAGYPQTWAARICLARRIVLPSAADQRRQWADIQHRLGNSLHDPIQGLLNL